MPPDLTWAHFGGDGGELITASLTLGVPHPSGYPTYIVLGKLFSFLPIGDFVFRYYLFSATAVSLAATFLTLTVLSINKVQKTQRRTSPLPTIAVGLLFAFTPLVWSQAIIAEVYGLNLLMLSLFLWALLGKRPFFLTGLFLGLAITTHLTSLFFIPLALIYTPHSGWKKMGVGFIVGLTPFLLIPLLAMGNSPIVWGNPSTMRGWWWLVSGTIYRPNQFAFTDINFAAKATEWLTYFRLPFLLLITVGIFISFKRPSSPPHLISPAPLLLTATALILYAFTYNSNDAIVLILPAILLLWLLLAPTLAMFEGFALLLPLLLLLLNFNVVNLRDDRGIRPYAEQLLTSAPPNAILQTNGDPALFTLWYLHFIEEQRPDIAIVDNHLFAFDWYRERLQQTYPDLIVPQADDLAKLQADNAQKRPYCFVDIILENNIPTIQNSCSEGSP